jgi:translation initiation factor IF-2
LKAEVGDVSESDVFLAKSSQGAIVIAFEAKISSNIKRLAETEDVEIYSFEIIYELVQKIEESLENKKVKTLGKALVVEVFPYEKMKVAGCRITEGKIGKGDKVFLMRGEKTLGEVKIKSIRKQKSNIEEVGQGEECGILFTPGLDFNKGDVLVSVAK